MKPNIFWYKTVIPWTRPFPPTKSAGTVPQQLLLNETCIFGILENKTIFFFFWRRFPCYESFSENIPENAKQNLVGKIMLERNKGKFLAEEIE